ncbi:tubulin-tyrosine ligase/Tubulin polyglutamylase, partial [Ochromonadaceae sp. CCMP2298]
QKVNHFPASGCLGRKDSLVYTLDAMRYIHGDVYDIHPETFVLPTNHALLLRTFAAANTWILKPRNSSCGVGIEVLSAEQVLQLPPTRNAIVQRYIANPYLIEGKKFDLRVYVLCTGVNPLKVYIHKEGLTRLSTAKYSMSDLGDR